MCMLFAAAVMLFMDVYVDMSVTNFNQIRHPAK